MEDSEIIALYWERNEEAITETSAKYEAYLSKVASNILDDPEDSRECVSDTYWKAWNSIPPHRPGNLSAFLAKITRELSIDVFRRQNSGKRQGSQYALSLSELGDSFGSGVTPEEQLESRELTQAINRFLRTLPKDTRNLFLGRYFFFDSLKDAAAYCGMTEAGAKSLLHRTRKRLKAYLEKEGFTL
ncbi:MAG: sigma-70 family RNA polymerase sigma factor [Oscillospiraceae bacterium]|nr:sigma-70 family RNA polymerase sigma factor [Oscillospiraceae bacterium]